jgi:hypothetical protein
MLDLAKGMPFGHQLRANRREDRVSRSTGNPFMEWVAPDEVRAEVCSICDEINRLSGVCGFTLAKAEHENVAASLAHTVHAPKYSKLRARLEAMTSHSKLLKLIFHNIQKMFMINSKLICINNTNVRFSLKNIILNFILIQMY